MINKKNILITCVILIIITISFLLIKYINKTNFNIDDIKTENNDLNDKTSVIEENNEINNDDSSSELNVSGSEVDLSNTTINTGSGVSGNTGIATDETTSNIIDSTDNEIDFNTNDEQIENEKEEYEVYLDFSSLSINESLSRSKLNALGILTDNWDNGLSTRTKIIDDNGNNILQVYYPAGGYGPQQTGMQVEFILNDNIEYYMSYDFMFDENFSFGSSSKGGKLPGITGGERCGSDFICDGTNGFSARFMWRSEGLGELYLYHADKTGSYGDDIAFMSNGSQVQFSRNKWYNIKEYVKMNIEPNKYDAVVKIWINDILVVDITNIRLSTNGDMIDTFYFSTFHGGSTSAWAVGHDSYMYYDNINLSKNNFFGY
ncbi:MAG: polysaccharide lyase [Bacilli bacterium]